MRATLLLAATVLAAQTRGDPAGVLDQARAKIVATMKRLPRYACVQTIERTYYSPAKPRHGATPCDRSENALRLDAADRLRLDVAQGTEHEIHSWPGASRFDLTEIDQIVDNGPFGTGSFGGYLLDIFDNDATRFDYRGAEIRDGKQVLVYSYTVARSASHYEIRTYGSWATTAYSGTFEVNPESLEIERIILVTPKLPAETGLCEARSTLDYQRVEIGDGSFLLPRQSQLHLILRNGQETENNTAFTDCREYQAHSEVHFDTSAITPDKVTASSALRPAPVSRRYSLDLRMNEAIDTDRSAAGDPVSATVVHDVHPSQSKETAIPAGAVAHGRISRIEHHFIPLDYLVIGISFQTLEIDGVATPFDAKPTGSGVSPSNVSRSNSDRSVVPTLRTPLGPPNTFVFPYQKRHVMAAGTVSEWVTVYPPHAKPK